MRNELKHEFEKKRKNEPVCGRRENTRKVEKRGQLEGKKENNNSFKSQKENEKSRENWHIPMIVCRIEF